MPSLCWWLKLTKRCITRDSVAKKHNNFNFGEGGSRVPLVYFGPDARGAAATLVLIVVQRKRRALFPWSLFSRFLWQAVCFYFAGPRDMAMVEQQRAARRIPGNKDPSVWQ